MTFKKCRLLNHSLRKLEYDYNPVAGAVNMQIKTGTNAKVPIDDLTKPCILEYLVEIASENDSLNLRCITVLHFKVDGPKEYDIEELRNHVLEEGSPIAYRKVTEIIKTITGYSNSTPFTMPSYQAITKGQK